MPRCPRRQGEKIAGKSPSAESHCASLTLLCVHQNERIAELPVEGERADFHLNAFTLSSTRPND